MKARIKVSLNCNGVIADTYSFFEKALEDNFGVKPNQTFYECLKTGEFSSYEQEQRLKAGEVSKFLGDYEALLFENLGKLKPMQGVQSGIVNLLEKGYKVMMNSYRSDEYQGKKQDTRGLTLEWLAKNNIPIDEENVHLAKDENEKIGNIFKYLGENHQGNRNNYRFHIDDNTKILKKIKETTPFSCTEFAIPIWFENSYNDEKHFPKEVRADVDCNPIPSKPMNFVGGWSEVSPVVKRIIDTHKYGGDIFMCCYIPDSVRLDKEIRNPKEIKKSHKSFVYF